MIDLDRFKAVNDTLGHHAGDELLRQLSRRIIAVKGEDDMIARLGGDEFGLIHAGESVGKASAHDLIGRIISVVNQPFTIDGHTVTIGCSLGMVISPDHGLTTDVLIKRADLALYAAKSSGQGGLRTFENCMEEKADRERRLRDELIPALSNDQFHLNFQPIIDGGSSKIVCCEALLRWNHPELGPISPAEFVPAAETSGMIVAIGQWVLEQACLHAAQWPKDVKIAVNLSPKQFVGFKLAASVARALANSGLAPERLELEITESVFLSDSHDNIQILNELKGLGVRIALDDFGTGYSSLAYLRKFSFDKLKIDRSFVTDVATSKENLAIVRAVVGLGRSFAAIVTAEGVESAEQYTCLKAEGCDQFQGYLFSRPVSAPILQDLFAQLDGDTPRTALLD